MADGLTYKMGGGNAARLCIIVTDCSDTNKKMMDADFENIKQLVTNLGITTDNILKLDGKTSSVISTKIGEFCKRPEIKSVDYIMTFILACRSDHLNYSIANKPCNLDKFRTFFVANVFDNDQWAEKPKLIFHQAPFEKFTAPIDAKTNPASDSAKDNDKFNLPIATNIMEAFACIGHQDSFGNEAGSYYIQALCKIFNDHIERGSIYKLYLSELMYDVHAKVRELVTEHKAKNEQQFGHQTPYVKSTFVKNFRFPK